MTGITLTHTAGTSTLAIHGGWVVAVGNELRALPIHQIACLRHDPHSRSVTIETAASNILFNYGDSPEQVDAFLSALLGMIPAPER